MHFHIVVGEHHQQQVVVSEQGASDAGRENFYECSISDIILFICSFTPRPPSTAAAAAAKPRVGVEEFEAVAP